MYLEQLCVWINAIASVLILFSVLRLYEVNHANYRRAGRLFLASIALSAIYSCFEILAWKRPIPLGMTAFLVLLAVAWAMRAFYPAFMLRLFPPGVGVTGAAASARASQPAPARYAMHR